VPLDLNNFTHRGYSRLDFSKNIYTLIPGGRRYFDIFITHRLQQIVNKVLKNNRVNLGQEFSYGISDTCVLRMDQ